MSLVRNLHVLLAYETVIGFVIRMALAFSGSASLANKAVRILPHIIDTVLLGCGFALVFALDHSFGESWLTVKLLALLAYIGFGVLTLRASRTPLRLLGAAGALLSVGYIFLVALSRNPLPF
ncbi:MAG: hypothetical protein FJ194_06695 [Gammaproteobacteria bacterium]|nr:hypothetical protein [Gammaproteobacteria bacterium]